MRSPSVIEFKKISGIERVSTLLVCKNPCDPDRPSIINSPRSQGTNLARSGVNAPSGTIPAPPIRTTQRKRGKCMSRRKGQNPKLRIGTHSDGSQYFYFQYWLENGGRGEKDEVPSGFEQPLSRAAFIEDLC